MRARSLRRKDFKIPVLITLVLSKDKYMLTPDISTRLKEFMYQFKKDKSQLEGSVLTEFDKKVYSVFSSDTLENKGLINNNKLSPKRSLISLTEEGEKEVLKYFSYEQENILEKDLIIPTLLVLSSQKFTTNQELKENLEKLIPIKDSDLETLNGRTETKFKSKVNNLISHKTLEKKGFVNIEKLKSKSLLSITTKGLNEIKRYFGNEIKQDIENKINIKRQIKKNRKKEQQTSMDFN